MNDAVTRFFDQGCQNYQSLARYSSDILDQALNQFLSVLHPNQRDVLDIGAGDGYPASRLIAKRPDLRLTLLDCSTGMLSVAKRRFSELNYKPTFVQGDLNNLCFAPNSFDAIFSCCTIQFIRDIHNFLSSLREILRPKSKLFFGFNDRDDLKQELVHQLFPGFNEMERARHWTSEEFISKIQKYGFATLYQERFPYQLYFPTRLSFIEFVASRPFSGFAFISDSVFQEKYKIFTEKANQKLPETDVKSNGRITVVIAEKRP